MTTDISSLSYRPEFIEGDEAANRASLTEYGNAVSKQIESMQEQRQSWRSFLQQLYEDDVAQDNIARDLKRRVLIGEAESLANPTYHRWLRSREQHGVGQEKLDSWYTLDSLLPHTPYVATVPCPRNLSDRGWEMIEETILELFSVDDDDDDNNNENSENKKENTTSSKITPFTIEFWPLLQHEQQKNNNNATQEAEQQQASSASASAVSSALTSTYAAERNQRRNPTQTSFTCYSSKELRKLVEATPALQTSLVETPCFLLGDSATTRRLSHSNATPLVVYVVRGTVIAVEPYYKNSCSSSDSSATSSDCVVKFPSRLVNENNNSSQQQQQLTSANCRALLLLREWMEEITQESLPERSFGAAVMMHCISPSEVSFSLLNVTPLDAVDCNYFTWSDMVGLIVNSQSGREFGYEFDEDENDENVHDERSKNKKEEKITKASAADGESVSPKLNEQQEQEQEEEEERHSLVPTRIAPRKLVDVIFRGPWIRCDEKVSSATMNVLTEISNSNSNNNNNNNSSSSTTKNEQQQQQQQVNTKSENNSSSGLSVSTVVASAAVACVASAAIGIGLGMKMANNNKN